MYSLHNIHFKLPTQQQPEKPPSPPEIEPLSPFNHRPRPIEPSFNYPAVAQQSAHALNRPPAPQNTNGASSWAESAQNGRQQEKRGHHRKMSSMDALADAAMAMNPHKRARTDAYPSIEAIKRERAEQEKLHREQMQRLEVANMLLNFSNTDARMHPPRMWPETGRPVSDSLLGQAPPAVPMDARPRTTAVTSFEHYQPPQYTQHMRPPSGTSAFSSNQSRGSTSSSAAAQSSAKHPRKRLHQSMDSATSNHTWQAMDLPPTHSSFVAASLPSPPSNGLTPTSELSDELIHVSAKRKKIQQSYQAIQQVRTPPEELAVHLNGSQPFSSQASTQHSSQSRQTAQALPPKRRGWPKGKPRGPNATRVAAPKRKRKTADNAEHVVARRHSFSNFVDVKPDRALLSAGRSHSVPPEINMIIRKGPATRRRKIKTETSCAGCRVDRKTATAPGLELDDWISCNGCKQWFHLDCAGFKAAEVRDVDKFFCSSCETKHGKTTYVRKSRRAHTSVDYAELQKGNLKTSDESTEHHYIQPIKDGTFVFDPETFPRVRPELLTKDYFERAGFTEPVCIPAAWNRRPWDTQLANPIKEEASQGETVSTDNSTVTTDEFEFDCVEDEGQDSLDMVMPIGLTVRRVCNLVGAYTPLDVIDVKTQNSGAKWNLAKWADYYESNAEDKPVRNVISLEVSHTKLGRLLRRPKVVRDIDLQDQVWPQEEIDRAKWPKVQYYCLMSIADSYTDFHIDFGGSSVYYHLIKGKKTFFFIPPKAKHLKAYEEWNNNPQQNFTFLPHITKECYRVDLHEGDTMLIPSGWIHAVWTPETSLVIGGNFLTRMSFGNQFKVAEIEKNNETPQKFRYPYFQRLMWWTAIDYMEKDPMPPAVEQLFLDGKQFMRETPIWQEFDSPDDDKTAEADGRWNARYYSQAEVDGLPELVNFIWRTVLISHGCMDGITVERVKRVASGIPVSKRHDGPLQLAKAFALWVAWKRGDENPPAWAHPSYVLPAAKDEKKLSAKAIKDLERKEAIAARAKLREDRQAKRAHKQEQPLGSMQDTSGAQVFTGEVNHASPFYDTIMNHAQPRPEPAYAPNMMLHTSNPVHQFSGFQQDISVARRTPSPTIAPAQPLYHESSFQLSDFPSADMTGASQHISTPKTSVLGPRRVACDPCRRRRIKCKHKDFVVQASPDRSVPPSDGSNQESNGLHHGYDPTTNGTVQPLQLEDSIRVRSTYNGAVPMLVNGVPLFTDVKPSRNKVLLGSPIVDHHESAMLNLPGTGSFWAR